MYLKGTRNVSNRLLELIVSLCERNLRQPLVRGAGINLERVNRILTGDGRRQGCSSARSRARSEGRVAADNDGRSRGRSDDGAERSAGCSVASADDCSAAGLADRVSDGSSGGLRDDSDQSDESESELHCEVWAEGESRRDPLAAFELDLRMR